jgi:hypothetical protein
MPRQDGHLPDQIEAFVHQAGLELQRRLFRVLIEKADQELVLQQRHGKGDAGIQRRGTRPVTFKTTFGAVTVGRSRILHKQDGTIEVPAAVAWDTSHQLMITQNLRDAVCDQMSDQSAGKSRVDVCQYAGDEDLLGRSTIIDIVHHAGEPLIVAQRERARAILCGASEAQLALLGPATADPDAGTGLGDDDPPWTTPEEAQAAWEDSRPVDKTGVPGVSRRLGGRTSIARGRGSYRPTRSRQAQLRRAVRKPGRTAVVRAAGCVCVRDATAEDGAASLGARSELGVASGAVGCWS